MALLEIRGVTKRFGGLLALDGVDLRLEEGMIASLIGPNGAGKTTLFHILTGIYRPDHGEIRFGDRSLIGLSPDRITKIGICRTFQNIRLFAHMSVLENVLIGMHSRIELTLADILFRSKHLHAREKENEIAAMELLRLVSLEGKASEWAHHLSYGDQRRLELARPSGLSCQARPQGRTRPHAGKPESPGPPPGSRHPLCRGQPGGSHRGDGAAHRAAYATLRRKRTGRRRSSSIPASWNGGDRAQSQALLKALSRLTERLLCLFTPPWLASQPQLGYAAD